MNPLLKKILHTESESGNEAQMQNLVETHCLESGWKVETDTTGNIYVTKGAAESFPCYAAHLDTIHSITGDGIALITLGDNVTGINPRTMQQTGIGGDDKCGIYCALRCLEELPACKAIFFVDEERGCVGSGACDLAFFSDCRFVIQADRRGNADFVTDINGELSSRRFKSDAAKLLKRFGFKPSSGAMTDVLELRNREIGLSVANLSAGYYAPHTPGEFINLTDLENSLALMVAIGREMARAYPFKPAPRVTSWDYWALREWGTPTKTPKSLHTMTDDELREYGLF